MKRRVCRVWRGTNGKPDTKIIIGYLKDTDDENEILEKVRANLDTRSYDVVIEDDYYPARDIDPSGWR